MEPRITSASATGAPLPDEGTDGRSNTPSLDPADDEALARALIVGEERAHRAAWTRFAPMVRRILSRTFGPRQDVDDIQQDVFLNFFRKVPGLRQPESLKAFVVSITVRTIKHELRSRRARRFFRVTEDDVTTDTRYTEQPDLGANEAFKKFYAILDRLSAADQMAFSLRYFEEFELADVARALGVSVSTAKRRLARIWKLVAARVRQSPTTFGYFAQLPSDDAAGFSGTEGDEHREHGNKDDDGDDHAVVSSSRTSG